MAETGLDRPVAIDPDLAAPKAPARSQQAAAKPAAAKRAAAKPAASSPAPAPAPAAETESSLAPVSTAATAAPPAPVAPSEPATDPAADRTDDRTIDRTAEAAADRVTEATTAGPVLLIENLSKRFDHTVAVSAVDLAVSAGSIFGIVGPNGAGKTTTLSMVTGLLRPDSGRVLVHGADVWANPAAAKRNMGVLPDRLRVFDRLTGAQLLYYAGVLRGLDRATVLRRSRDLATAFGLEDALGRMVTDYSAGMTKKLALAAAMIHSPRLLILDEPFEAVDPVSAAGIIEILQKYAAAGGTVVMSSHSMDLIQRICDSVAIVVHGTILASGTMQEVRAGGTLEERFVQLAGGRKAAEGMEWLHNFSD
ncbi:MAG: ABC transporter ATP-binding protein [Burkholderiaceae bacterium]|nr:ABC transporter ATP-binding protein [Microbacteriaceae bacterium]